MYEATQILSYRGGLVWVGFGGELGRAGFTLVRLLPPATARMSGGGHRGGVGFVEIF